jgi:hypothetical protein
LGFCPFTNTLIKTLAETLAGSLKNPINIEGSEYKVLNDLIKSGTINRIESLQVQFHRNTILYPVKAYLAVSKLKKTHKLIWDYKFVWARWDLKSS